MIAMYVQAIGLTMVYDIFISCITQQKYAPIPLAHGQLSQLKDAGAAAWLVQFCAMLYTAVILPVLYVVHACSHMARQVHEGSAGFKPTYQTLLHRNQSA